MDDAGILVNQPFVVDSGSSAVRAGFAGESEPPTVFPAYVGRPKHDRAMVGSLDGSVFVGDAAQQHRGLMALRYPMARGVVTDWADMERVWQHMYAARAPAAAVNPEDHPVLVTEPPHNPRRNREQMAQVFFETFNVPALYCAVPAVLALYAAGKTSGLVLDVGDGVAHAVPVYQGFSLSSAVARTDLAGADVTDFLQLLLRKLGVRLTTSAEREIVKHIKETHAFVAPQLAQPRGGALPPADDAAADEPVPYKLPDGQRISLTRRELGRAPELLFRPHIVGSEDRSVARLLADAVARSDIDLRPTLYQNMVLSGGTTQTRGFGDRLLNEMKALAPQSTKLRIFAPPNRDCTVWVGGSILAGLSTFRKMWLTADEWAENPERVHAANN